jgi:putative FmdB family regulatory protein
MPTYSYQCKRCGHIHDLFHGISERPRVKCPKCGGPCVRLIGTGAGVIFKGSGFYETDYKRKAGASDKGAEGGPSDSKPESKAETKPETKSESRGDGKPKSKSKAGDAA